MSESAFDAFSRCAGETFSRRSSLETLGGAALAAMVAMPGDADAGKSSKNKNAKRKQKKQAKKQSLKLCQQQVGQCQTFMNAECEGNGCGAVVSICCPLLGTCQNEAFFTCLVDSLNEQTPAAADS